MNGRRALVRRLRLGVWAAVLLATAFSVWRFDLTSLPAAGCSPLRSLDPGARLLVDLHPPALGPGDVVLFREDGGDLLLGRVEEPPASAPAAVWDAVAAGSFWVVADAADCPAPDSRLLGPIPPGGIEGKVVLAF